jgi:putative DNA primase/helicase
MTNVPVVHNPELCGLDDGGRESLCPGCRAAAGRQAQQGHDVPRSNGTAPPRKPAPSTTKSGTPPTTHKGEKSEAADGKLENRSYHLTDLGNAKRVVDRHGQDWRYCHPFGKSFLFDGKRWAEDDTGAALRLVKETQAGLYQWTAECIGKLGDVGDDEARKEELAALTKVLKHCLKWEDARRINACLQLATSEPGIPVLPPELDRDPWVLNVLNGTIELRTGKLREHRREDLITKLAPVTFDPHALCPLWMKSLRRWMDNSEELVTYLQRAIGYSLSGDVGEQCLFFLHGSGANGKSTLLGTLKAMLGGYGYQAVPELLMAKNTEAHPTERADLFGRRFVCTIETDEGKWIAEALMKQLTGGDPVTARKMRQDFFEFDMHAKIFLAANHKPQVKGTDYAVWRRIKLVPFVVTIPDSEKDKNLLAKLKTEWPGILAWAVRGCLDWQREGLAEPDEVRDATNQYRAEQDSIQGFLDECCFVHDTVKARSSILFDAYQKWSGDKVMTPPTFRKRLKEKGYDSKKGAQGYAFFLGVGLQNPMDEGSEGEGR